MTALESLFAAIESFKAYRWSRSRRRYHRFLRLRDAFPDVTFREFLISPEFAGVRGTA